GPRQSAQALRRNRLFATQADTIVAGLQPVKSFVDQPQLPVVHAVEAQRHEFIVGDLCLIFFPYAAEAAQGVELDPHGREDFSPLLDQLLPVSLVAVDYRCGGGALLHAGSALSFYGPAGRLPRTISEKYHLNG